MKPTRVLLLCYHRAPKQIAGLFFQFMRILGKGGFASDNLESSVTQPTPLRPLYPRLPRRSPPTSTKKSWNASLNPPASAQFAEPLGVLWRDR